MRTYLTYDDTVNLATGWIITSLEIVAGDCLTIKLRNNLFSPSTLKLWDNAQNCCELRHTSTDDDLTYYVGSVFLGARIANGPSIDGGCDDCHDTQFLIIKTSLGEFTVVNHNEHNGYYSGFNLTADFEIGNSE